MKLECTSLSRLKSAKAERSKNRGAQSATKLCGAAARSERTCIAPALRAIRGTGPAPPQVAAEGAGQRSTIRGHLLQTSFTVASPLMATPRPIALCPRRPSPLLSSGPGPLGPHSPGRTARLAQQLQRESKRARRRAGVGGAAACRPSSPESECRGGSRALGEPSLPPPALLALRPAGTSGKKKNPSDLPRPKQGPQVASPVLRAPDRPPAASGAPEWGALGPRSGGRSRRTDFPAPPAPAASHLRLSPPSPSLAQWLHSFLPGRSTNIYRVPTGCPALGRTPQGRRERNPRLQPSRDSHLEVAKV